MSNMSDSLCKLRTEMIMQNIEKEMYDGDMPGDVYNKMYWIIYNTLKKIALRNFIQAMGEMGINLVGNNPPRTYRR